MARDNDMSNKGDLYSNIPGAVALAAIIVMTAGAHAMLGAFLSVGLTVEGLIQLVYGIFVIMLGYQLLFLEKWTYWAFLVLVTLGCLNAISDIMLAALDGIIPTIPVVLFIITALFVIVFLSSPVRTAFGVKRFW